MSQDPPLRRHHRGRDGPGVLHPPGPARQAGGGAALQLAGKMGLSPALLVHAKAVGPAHTFFVVYGSVTHLVELDKVQVHERDFPLLAAKEINGAIKKALRRPLVVVGACIGTDAHTVGIDAILNIKGFAGEKGLEYYSEIRVVNLGAQVLVPELVERARAEQADAVLVSQVVTQRDAHIANTTQMSAAFRGLPRRAGPAARRGRPPLRGGDRPGARRRPHLRQGHHARGGGLIPRPRPVHLEGAPMSTTPGTSHDPAARPAAVGMGVTHARYVPYSHAHYAGNLVDGAYSLALFGDVATELCIRTDGDEGLFASYSDVQFLAPVRAGDCLEVSAVLARVGSRSREMDFEVRVVARGTPEAGVSAAEVLDPPVVATRARGTVVVPPAG